MTFPVKKRIKPELFIDKRAHLNVRGNSNQQCDQNRGIREMAFYDWRGILLLCTC